MLVMGFLGKNRLSGAAGALALACGLGLAQESKTMLMEPPIPLLPAHFTGWDRQGDAAGGKDPAQADAANAAVLKEDGLTRFAVANYARAAAPTGKAAAGSEAATAMQFGDATGAYSAFTFYESKMPHPHAMTGNAKLGTQSFSDGDTVVVWAGTVVLRANGAAATKELAGLSAALPKVGGRNGLPPLLPTLAPAKGLVPASIRYALGPAGYQAMGGVLQAESLAFDKSAEVLTAEYPGHAGKGTLTMLLYPTPEIAGERGREIEKELNAPGIGSHGSLGTVKMRRVGPLLGVTSGGFSAEQAEELIAGLSLNQEISFDKKMPLEFHTEVKKTASLLENIAVFSGVMGAAAILLGVFLGGARAGWRVMHGKSASIDPEFLTINLREQPTAVFAGGTEPGEIAKTIDG